MREIISWNEKTDMLSVSVPFLIVVVMVLVVVASMVFKLVSESPTAPRAAQPTADPEPREPLHFFDSHVIEHNPEENKPFVVYELDDIAAGGFECSSQDEAKRLVKRLEERKVRSEG